MWMLLVALALDTPESPQGLCAWSHGGERKTERAPKGVEMYSWQQPDGAMEYSLLLGTNREKLSAAIRDRSCVMRDLPALKTALSQLAEGERVFWMASCSGGSCSLPGPPVVQELREHAKSLGITLDVIE